MHYSRSEILDMLSSEGSDMDRLFSLSEEVKFKTVGDKIYLRGLIEYSNVCRKDCLYCGIRCSNRNINRYTLTEEQVLDAARTAHEANLGSVVLQGGENSSPEHIETIERLIKEIKFVSGGRLGITLSLGEQSGDTLKRWFDAGAHRYLLRIETSSPELYARIHPHDARHSFEARLDVLHSLRRLGYQVGTGVMIGLPCQTVGDLAGDVCFMRDLDIDMCGMGPYIESENTPLSAAAGRLLPSEQRLALAFKMVAVMRIVMPDINIVSTTALGSLSPDGRYLAVKYGANVLMPNITPMEIRKNYALYNDKSSEIDPRLLSANIGYGEWGDSLHFCK